MEKITYYKRIVIKCDKQFMENRCYNYGCEPNL